MKRTIIIISVVFLIQEAHPLTKKEQQRLNVAFIEAAVKNDIILMKSLLEKGAHIDGVKDWRKYTALHLAALNGSLESMKFLLSRGARLDIRTGSSGDTILISAVKGGNIDCITYLLKTKVKKTINRANHHGATPYDLVIGTYPYDVEHVKKVRSLLQSFGAKPGIFYAVLRGDLETIINLLRSGIRIDSRNHRGETPIMAAISNNKEEIFMYLIRNGADMNSFDNNFKSVYEYACDFSPKKLAHLVKKSGGRPGFYTAVTDADFQLIEFWLGKGISINAQDTDGSTAIHIAARSGKVQTVDYLVRRGANVNLEDNDGDTPLITAAHASKEMIKYLLSKGAKISHKNGKGETVFIAAVRANKLDIVQYLISQGVKTKVVNYQGNSAYDIANEKHLKEMRAFLKKRGVKPGLVGAIKEGNLAVVQERIEEAPDPKKLLEQAQTEIPEKTPLYLAISLGKLDIARYLISKGAKVNSGFEPAIKLAYSTHDIAFLEYLVKVGADVNSGFQEAVYQSCLSGNIAILDFLIKNGAKINRFNEKGYTPLHELLTYKNSKNKVKVLHHLLSAGAIAGRRTPKGQTPLMLAAHANDVEAIRLLLTRKVEINARDEKKYSALLYAADFGSQSENRTEEPFETFKVLVEAGADINACDDQGSSALMLASRSGRINIIKYLISRKVKIDTADKYGRTALLCAARGNHLDAVRLLIKSGAEINAKDIRENTVIIHAINKRNVKMVRLAVASGADVNLKTKHGNALSYARRTLKHLPDTGPLEEIIKILKAAGAKEAP